MLSRRDPTKDPKPGDIFGVGKHKIEFLGWECGFTDFRYVGSLEVKTTFNVEFARMIAKAKVLHVAD